MSAIPSGAGTGPAPFTQASTTFSSFGVRDDIASKNTARSHWAGAERAAIAYTILAGCELADVDPVAYLTDILPRMALGLRLSDGPERLPLTWKTAQT